jgi:enoyl-CoA hydratase
MDLKAFVAGESMFVEHRGFAGIVQGPAAQADHRAVEGFAVAGGFEIALACDLIVASRGTKLGIPEVKRSLVAAGGALLRLPSRIPYHVAMELAAHRRADHRRARRRARPRQPLTEPARRSPAARELAAKIAVNGPLALAASKRILVEAPGWPAAEAWQRQAEITDPVFGSQDAREGATAFAEKRDPVWRGL